MKYVFVCLLLTGCGPSFVSKKQILAEVRANQTQLQSIDKKISIVQGQISTLEQTYQGFTLKRLENELQEIKSSADTLRNADIDSILKQIRKLSNKP